MAAGTALASHFSGLHVELSPLEETKPVYSEHAVTAEVSHVTMGLVPSALVDFEISGPDGTYTQNDILTDGNGVATFTFPNSGRAGTYTISAGAEFSASGTTLDGQSSAPATVTFTDGAPPTIVEGGLSPQKGATGVARDTNVMAPFSEIIKEETLSSSTFKLSQWDEKRRKWQRVPADAAHAVVDCTRFGATCLAMPRPACQIGEQGGELQGWCEVPTLNPYPSDHSKLLGARKKYRAVVTTGAQDLNGDTLAKAYAWKFTTGR